MQDLIQKHQLIEDLIFIGSKTTNIVDHFLHRADRNF